MTPHEPQMPDAVPDDMRPIVARPGGQLPLALLFGGVALGGVVLFLVLDGQRRAASAPAAPLGAAGVSSSAALPPLPPLFIPGPPPPAPAAPRLLLAQPAPTPTPTPTPPPPPPPRPSEAVYTPRPPQPPPLGYAPPPAFASQPAVAPVRSTSGGAALVIDGGRPAGASSPAGPEAGAPGSASRLSRRGATLAQGTLVPAVLETALDSTRPGLVRAIVSHDVTGFDGRTVLIPRGSRLFGEYQADLAPGQNRAFVMWTRLVRPDGVAVTLASPAADAQGRAGIPGRVDNHFFERFASALVQTTLNIGGAAVSRSIGDSPVVVALPGSSTGGTGQTASRDIRPTLHVPPGQRVSVFIAQDLELPPARSR